MSSSLTTFNFETHAVRVEMVDGNPLFCANDVCAALDYTNPREAMSKHCKEKGVTKRDTLTPGGKQELSFLNEANLYRLILRSRKPEAAAFSDWVVEEVLPSIRKTGAYDQQPHKRVNPTLTNRLEDKRLKPFVLTDWTGKVNLLRHVVDLDTYPLNGQLFAGWDTDYKRPFIDTFSEQYFRTGGANHCIRDYELGGIFNPNLHNGYTPRRCLVLGVVVRPLEPTSA